MADEGSLRIMAELVAREKELLAKIGSLEAQLQGPEERLEKTKAILLKAKAAFEDALAVVRPLRSDLTLLEGDLALLREEKSKARVRARLIEHGGRRPGTDAFVEQLDEMAGDKGLYEAKQAAIELQVDDDLAELKRLLGKE